ncbi:MAG: DNA (cytosine-5-)-methyltransferase [Nitrososphaerales archaeon]
MTCADDQRAGDLKSRDVIERVAELLEVTYRSADLGNVADVLSETIYIMLSLNAREGVYRSVYGSLKEAYPRWADALIAPAEELEGHLRPCGLQAQRARKVRSLLEAVETDNLARGVGPGAGDDLTLEYLRDLQDSEAQEFLERLPGVGRKSACCVMAYSLGRPRFAVDTHVERVFTRLGLAPPRKSKINHQAFEELVPPPLRKNLHVNLVHHGRAICGTTPKCSECVLVSFCRPGQEAVGTAKGEPVAIDLFAGAGGLGRGFRDAGYRVALAVENDRDAAQTYRANNPGVPVMEADVSTLTGDCIRSMTPGLAEPAVVLAGPPCQGYSAAGNRVPADEKNFLFRNVVKLAEELGASTVVIENVPGLRRVNGVSFCLTILSALRVNFEAELYELTASSFGVPQNRRRCFFLARRKGLGPAPTPPPATHRPSGTTETLTGPDRPTPTLEQTLRGPLEFGPGTEAEHCVLSDGGQLLNASTMRHSEKVIAKIALIGPGEGPISYRRLEPDLARTLIAGHRALPVHPWLNRTISVREAARIQGFPDTYVFCGPRSRQPLQVANAVPPPLAEAVARHLLFIEPKAPGGG